jgi:hypothetical protein
VALAEMAMAGGIGAALPDCPFAIPCHAYLFGEGFVARQGQRIRAGDADHRRVDALGRGAVEQVRHRLGVHDLSDGGLAVALAEMAMAGGIGAALPDCPFAIPGRVNESEPVTPTTAASMPWAEAL